MEVDGIAYPIDADFRNCLSIYEAFEDKRFNNFDKQDLAIKLLYNETPSNFESAVIAAFDFLDPCKEFGTTPGHKPVYSFSHDAKFIRSAIQDRKRINLDDIEFWHWWDFVFAFFDLRDTFFNDLIGVRTRLASGTATKEDRKFANESPGIVLLPVREVAHDSEDDEFMRQYNAAKQIRDSK